jgi:hypothetical protein
MPKPGSRRRGAYPGETDCTRASCLTQRSPKRVIFNVSHTRRVRLVTLSYRTSNIDSGISPLRQVRTCRQSCECASPMLLDHWWRPSHPSTIADLRFLALPRGEERAVTQPDHYLLGRSEGEEARLCASSLRRWRDHPSSSTTDPARRNPDVAQARGKRPRDAIGSSIQRFSSRL